MCYKCTIIVWCFLVTTITKAQTLDILSGPIYGHFTDSTQHFWMLVNPSIQNLEENWITAFNADVFRYFEQNTAYKVRKITNSMVVDEEQIIVQGILEKEKPKGLGKDICFMIGSCALNMPFPLLFLGKKRERIFDVMTQHDKDFMIWMGDNVYYLFGQWKTAKKMHKKNIQARINPKIRRFLESCPNYAIWDDHDYGPNDSDGTYVGKANSLAIFKQYWMNPYYGLDTAEGVYTHFSHADADFFMLDVRSFADADSTMLGKAQTDWLKEKLKNSTANFKFIISGSQIVTSNAGEDMGDFGNSRAAFYDFLAQEKINGVVIVSGDRHYGELLKLERDDGYPLYEITSSPLTSFIHPTYPKEVPTRIEGTLILETHFGKIHLFGSGEGRKCRLEQFNADGELLWRHDILLSELQY